MTKEILCCLVIFSLNTLNAQTTKAKTYKNVKIGTQDWMAENLDVSTFRNGDIIPKAQDIKEWRRADKEGKPAWRYKNPDSVQFGKLYNWYAVNDSRGLAPKGWHIASDNEWSVLIKYLGAQPGKKVKSGVGWKDNGNGTNSSGFNALPGSFEVSHGFVMPIGWIARWWSSTEHQAPNAWCYSVSFDSDDVGRSYDLKEKGLSVRCIKD